MTEPSPCYRLHDVCKNYGDSFRLFIERMEIPAGEVCCLLGPTGSGKSTLLRLLSGLEPISAGEIVLRDRRLCSDNLPLSLQRRMAMVFQRPLLLNATVRENVEYGLRLRKIAAGSSKVSAMLERLGLTEIASQSARTLSGGQIQLVALARALVLEPDVLLLDEPTANLDPARVALVEEVVAADRRERGATVVWATHNMFQARRVADRVVLLLNGRPIEAAPTQRFFDQPTDPRTAAFVQGTMVY